MTEGHKFADYEYVIRVGDKKPLYYPASVLEVLPGQAYKRSIQMVRQACRAPASNFDYITGQASRLFGVNGQLRNQDVVSASITVQMLYHRTS